MSATGVGPGLGKGKTVKRTAVFVRGWDPILEAGVTSQLRQCPDLRVLGKAERETAEVTVVVADSVTDDVIVELHRIQRSDSCPVVLVAGVLDDTNLVAAVEAGVVGMLRRHEASVDRLTQAIRGALVREGTVPPDLLGRLLSQVGALQRDVLGPKGLSFNRLATREVEVLRLVADGCDTSEIANRLSYSERTVKNVLHDVVTKLNARSRSQAVAFAVREGLI
jgi:DNA-binding NarL/FixJ family response regulator